MSPEQPVQHDTLAIAFVLEASLHVAREWRNRHIFDYCINILRRLNDAHPASRVRAAFVSYGTGDTVPSPILAKRFFVDFKHVIKDMTEDIARLGVGTTSSGGGRGMAALDGLVAALELFDILQGSQGVRAPVCHIIHIAGAAPDAARHPLWNDSPALDDITWDTLPLEIKKRNILFSTINLRPKLARFPELHAATVTGGTPPWFAVQPKHTLLLAPFAAPPSPFKATVPPKRANTNANDNGNPPDTKRPRLQPAAARGGSTESPKPAPKAIAAGGGAADANANPALPQGLPPMGRFNQQQLIERYRAAAEQIKALEVQIKTLREQRSRGGGAGDGTRGGCVGAAGEPDWEYQGKREMQIKFGQALRCCRRRRRRCWRSRRRRRRPCRRKQQQQQQQQQPPKELGSPFSLNAAMSTSSATPAPTPGQTNAASPALLAHARTASGTAPDNALKGLGISGPTTNSSSGSSSSGSSNTSSLPGTGMTLPTGFPNNPLMQAQYAKLFEQQRRGQGQGPQPVMGGGGMASAAPGPMGAFAAGGAAGGLMGLNQLPPAQAGGNGGAAAQAAQKSVKVWNGTLQWSGISQAGKKEMQCFVVATAAKPQECHAETWPSVLHLAPTREELSMADLQIWLKRTQPALCTIQQRTDDVHDQKAMKLRIGPWCRCSRRGSCGIGLAGAFFPFTGLPELPKRPPTGMAGVQAEHAGAGAQAGIYTAVVDEASQWDTAGSAAAAAQHNSSNNTTQQQQQQQMASARPVQLPFSMNAHSSPPGGATPNQLNMNAMLSMMGQGAPAPPGMMMGGGMPPSRGRCRCGWARGDGHGHGHARARAEAEGRGWGCGDEWAELRDAAVVFAAQ
ncbi:hypothetical protein BJ912DRAFT_1066819 [Pholiota molesta]|nr:hypothetical protein BJ912DRAFT_1066819 [Pholiota molesta]